MNKIELALEEPKIIRGRDAIMRIPAGQIVVVVRKGHDDDGKVLIKTNDTSNPFVTLSDGSLWGVDLTSYSFRIYNGTLTIN